MTSLCWSSPLSPFPLPPAPVPKVFVCTRGDQARVYAFSLLKRLRAQGIAADMDHSVRSLKAQFKYADKTGARWVAVIGEEELTTGTLRLRDMQASAERVCTEEELIAQMIEE